MQSAKSFLLGTDDMSEEKSVINLPSVSSRIIANEILLEP